MKKFAIKGLIILGIVVLLCIFLSGTLRTITTAKVRIARVRTGYFENEITLTGSLKWPDTMNLTVEGLTDEDMLVIRNMPVSAGSYVREGDLIAQCVVSNYDSRLSAMRESLNAKKKEYLELERKNGTMILTDQQEKWYSAYLRLNETSSSTQLLRQDLRLAAWRAGITLDEEDKLPEGCGDETLLDLRKALTAAEEEETTAEKAFEKMKLLNISEDVISYLDKKTELKEEMDTLTENITALRILNEQCASIRAPHTGYITATEMKAGDQIGMDTILLTMTIPGTEPVIRLEPEEDKLVIAAGTPVTLSNGDQNVDSVISNSGVTAGGGLYADASVNQAILSALGGATSLTEEKSVTAKLTYRAENASTLIPITALRGNNDNYYIYVANSAVDTLGAERYTIEQKSVTVLDMNDSVASISESLKNNTIVYLEDRQLTDGCEVMMY